MSFLWSTIQLVFRKKKKKKNYVVYWCWSRARDKCTRSKKKNPGSAPKTIENCCRFVFYNIIDSFLRPFTFKFSENGWVIVKIGLHVLPYEDAFWTRKKPQSKSLDISCILIGTRAYFIFICIAIYLVGSIFFVCNPVLFVQWSLNLIFRHVICIMDGRSLGSYCADSVTLR